MKRLSTLFVLLFAVVGYTQDWNTIKTFMPNQTIQAIAVGKGDTLLACGALYNGTALNIKRTNDNGESWTEEFSGFTEQSFRDLATSDSTNFFAIANEGVLIGNWGTPYWTPIGIPIDLHLRCIFFLNNSIGFIGADAGKIIKTTDGGVTWNVQPDGGIGSINDIYFLDELNGFICGFNYFKRTTDGGATWVDIEGYEAEHPSYQLNEIDFASTNTGYVCGDIGYVYKTVDGGLNWEKQVTGTEESLQSLDVLNENTVYVCGFENTILHTGNGETWNAMTSDQTEHYRAIQFNATDGFIVTQLGKVLNYKLPGASISEATDLNHIGVYPNPTNGVLNIQNPNGVSINSIIVRDLAGNQVLIFDKWKGATQINLADLSGGIYIITITTDNGTVVKKVSVN